MSGCNLLCTGRSAYSQRADSRCDGRLLPGDPSLIPRSIPLGKVIIQARVRPLKDAFHILFSRTEHGDLLSVLLSLCSHFRPLSDPATTLRPVKYAVLCRRAQDWNEILSNKTESMYAPPPPPPPPPPPLSPDQLAMTLQKCLTDERVTNVYFLVLQMRCDMSDDSSEHRRY